LDAPFANVHSRGVLSETRAEVTATVQPRRRGKTEGTKSRMSDFTSCLHIPAGSRYLLVYAWMIDACDGNECAAALLAYFAGWHDTKLKQAYKARLENDVAETHGMQRRRYAESLTQFHTDDELEAGILFYKRRSFPPAFALLASKGFISVFKNPNPRMRFDRTRHFLFHPEKVNAWLAGCVRSGKFAESNRSFAGSSRKPAGYPSNTLTNSDIANAISGETPKTVKGKRSRKSPDEPLPEHHRTINGDLINLAQDVVNNPEHNPRQLKINIAREHSKFVNHADQTERLCKGERGWRAAWRNWILGAIERAEKGQGGSQAAQGEAVAAVDEEREFEDLERQVQEQRASRKQEGGK
jgi:hypothetical protein